MWSTLKLSLVVDVPPNLCVRGNKCIFIQYSKHSKGYVFIGEHDNGNLIQFKSHDVTFLENDFPQ